VAAVAAAAARGAVLGASGACVLSREGWRDGGAGGDDVPPTSGRPAWPSRADRAGGAALACRERALFACVTLVSVARRVRRCAGNRMSHDVVCRTYVASAEIYRRRD